MLNWDESPEGADVGVWINSSYFVNAMTSMFDAAWKQKTQDMAQYFVCSDNKLLPQDLLKAEIEKALSVSKKG